ncbi:peptidase family M13-like protein, partial [Leptotrombidium deliense]
MLNYIAAPTWIENEQQLDAYYDEIGYISTDNYYSAYKQMAKWSRLAELRELKGDSNKLAFSPTVINAFFYSRYNKIVLTSGILHPPFYNPSAPVVMNFGGIGTVIGHEITHGFDDQGSQYDETGRWANWWRNDTRENYEERVKCFELQYSRQVEPVTGKKVNGTLTIGDNIADNGGIKQAFKAYKIYTATKEQAMDLKLPKS